jgi:hypothetical protein
MRTLSRLFLSAAIAVGLSQSPAANATTLVELSPQQLTDASDYIVRGTVKAVISTIDGRDRVWTQVQIAVGERLKGPTDLDNLTLVVPGGTVGDHTTVVHLAPRFATGEEVLVFAEIVESGLTVVTGMLQGKFTVRVAPEDGREMLVQYSPRQDRAYDPRFLPHPPVDQRIYVDDLFEAVRDHIDTGWDGKAIPGKSLSRLELLHPGVKALEVAR